jgi:DNA polymerase-3 subunit gamma/tau
VNYQALYRTYRPRVFDDVKGQDVIVRTLRNQIKTGRIAHAYLFCGSRGTGKTTCAKIMAQAVNCLNPADGNPCCECESCRSIQEGSSINVIEMDAASRNGVDDFRRIIDEIAYPPSEGKKVYIIDEVHMLTPAAFNAFLKTLEEPPDYAVFILATTDPQKLLPTVLSRCQRYDFRRISSEVIESRLKEVFAAEGIEAEDAAIHSIARRAEGGMRDALSIADRCASFFPGEKLTAEQILEVLGTADTSVWRSMLRHAVDGNASGMIRQFDDMLMDGKDVRQIISDFTWYLRDLLIFKASGGSSETDQLLEEEREELLADANALDEQQIMYYIEVLSELAMSLRNAANRRVLAEIALINLCRPESKTDLPDSMEARIARIEAQLESGVVLRDATAASGISAAAAEASGITGTAAKAAGAGMVPLTAGDMAPSPGVSSGAGVLPGSPGALAASSASAERTDAEPQAAASAGNMRDVPRAVVPELFQKIASQWKQTMNSLPNRGRGGVLAMCSEVSFSPNEPETLFITLEDNWYRSLANDKVLLESVSDAITAKYGVRPNIRFVNRSQGNTAGLTKISARVEALQKEGIQFPIEIEE